MPHVSEYDVETKFIDRLENIGYQYVDLKDYNDVLKGLRNGSLSQEQLLNNASRLYRMARELAGIGEKQN